MPYTTYIAALNDSLFNGLVSDVAILAAGNTTTQQLSLDYWSWDRVVRDVRFGKVVADAIYAAVLAHSGLPAANLYLNHGIDLSLPDSQDGLDAIAAAVPALAAICNQLKLMGVWNATYWQLWGLPQPTLAGITAALQAKADAAAITLFQTHTLNPAVSSGISPVQYKTLVADWVP